MNLESIIYDFLKHIQYISMQIPIEFLFLSLKVDQIATAI